MRPNSDVVAFHATNRQSFNDDGRTYEDGTWRAVATRKEAKTTSKEAETTPEEGNFGPRINFAVPADHPNPFSNSHGGTDANRSQAPFSAWPTGSVPWPVSMVRQESRFSAEASKSVLALGLRHCLRPGLPCFSARVDESVQTDQLVWHVHAASNSPPGVQVCWMEV